MPDRLAELRRQRALLQEHLAWLDAEIARESAPGPDTASALLPGLSINPFGPLPSLAASARSPASGASPPPTSSAPPSATASGATPAPISAAAARAPTPATPEIDALLDEHRVPPTSVRTDVRKGCFLYFAAALALVALVVTVLYFALTPR